MSEKPFKQLCDELHAAVEKLPLSIKSTDSDGYGWYSNNGGVTFRRIEIVDTRPRWRRWVDRATGK